MTRIEQKWLFRISIRLILTLIITSVVSACSGGASDEGESSSGLSVFAKDNNGKLISSIVISDSVTLVASLKDSSGVAVENQSITFSSSSGDLSSSSRLTDFEGNAQVVLDSSSAEAGVITVTVSANVNGESFSNSVQIDAVAQTLIGEVDSFYFGSLDSTTFTSGDIYADNSLLINDFTTIGAGSSFGLSVAIVDQDLTPVTTVPFEVTFTSTCVTAGKAVIDESVFSIKGIASTTYQDISCAGPDGNEDNIIATVIIDSTQYTASRTIVLQPEKLGSIAFVSADPESIVLKGVGGQGKQETSTLTFLVKGELGNPQPQKEVRFSLNTEVGGIKLLSESGLTNANGLVTANVLAGTVPTVVRVTASVSNDGVSVSTQSDRLSVNTGLPDQNSMSLAFSTFNPEARDFSGQEVTVTAFLADSFNNPVPDGTTVNFTTEGGSISPSCNTESGSCFVTWKSQAPHADDHRVTVLATAVGHEYFVDVNGNNAYDDEDGAAINAMEQLSSGFFGISQQLTGFVDMSEPWRDDNENFTYDLGEQFLDDDGSELFTEADKLFNGPQCQASICPDNTLITIRKAGVIITSGSEAFFKIKNKNTGDVYHDDFGGATVGTIPANTDIIVEISDSQLQTLAKDTKVIIGLNGVPDDTEEPTYVIANTQGTGAVNTFNGIVHELNTGNTAFTLGVLVTTPNAVTTSFSIDIN